MLSIMKLILDAMARLEKWIAGICIATIMVLMVMDVFGRNVLKDGIVWAQKLSLHLMLWAGLLGASITSSKGGHLRPEIADKLWPKSFQPVLKSLEHFLISAFCATMAFFALKYILHSLETGDKTPVTELPMWLVQGVIPYTLASMAVRHFTYAFISEIRPKDLNEAEEALQLEAEVSGKGE
ncbi:Tripartite ATP-independent periplasmic transporter DctQ component [Turneriella parva DSM 21527]|uniref:Tripartite ATP-independent periplasmic transporter DctQ component n=2 Tax=Turneriella TaxID=338321 RepID=I4B8U0_TURPD|nr:Tripartite ATP-independent periplasmic transporter DctQ component [Turneriella parva DSM 21527]